MITNVTDNERAQAATIEALRQEVTAWSVTVENLEAELESKLDSDLEKIAAERYKVVPAHESMFHRWAVVAGDGTQQLYLGREAECQNMARKFAGAFLDGAYLARQLRQEITAENLEAERDTLKSDAARWVYWRDYHGFSGYFDEGATASPESADIDAACDAAMKRVQP